jgi:glycosyltransferase involved in cell wall biosynthesis
VIPTRDRAAALRQTLKSLARQLIQPAELSIVDASNDGSTRLLCVEENIPGLRARISWHRAELVGAASQRNQGVAASCSPVIGFMDDDIILEPDCFARLWSALQSDPCLGGVNAMITNQHYQTPGRISRLVFRLMAGRGERSYAGRVLGPAVNLLPEDREELPEVVPVDWLNTTCTLYRREALPVPPFPDHFKGYSMMEDVTLSLTVGKRWRLANARTARIYHDSQPGAHKADAALLAEMHLTNRYYVMKQVLGRIRLQDHLKLAAWVSFSHLSALVKPGSWRLQAAQLRGEYRALSTILRRRDTRV